MALDTITAVTDDVSDNLASYANEKRTALNKLMPSTPYAGYGAASSMTGNVTLTDADLPLLSYSPTAARDLTLPAVATTNHPFYVVNRATAYDITVKNASATVIGVVAAGMTGVYLSDGANGWYEFRGTIGTQEFIERASAPTTPGTGKWRVYAKSGGIYIVDDAGTETGPLGTGGGSATLAITGCRLIWNSGSSLSVGTGVCYAENGDEIDITSTLTASSLTPSASTWYHIYVYLSGGSPAMEVVTTAPAAWKGTAYSKTSDTTRRYIGSAKSDASGTPVFYNFEHIVANNQINYRLQSQAATPFRVLSSGTATATTSVSLAGVVPVTGALAYLRFFNSSDSAAHYGTATLTTTAYQIVINVGNTVNQSNYAFITMDSSQVIYYMLASRTAGVSHIDTLGYIYNR